jgi:glycerol-3-phosphate dehydrogenase
MDRQTLLGTLRSGREFDILVVGGGVTGAGVALDAASRGLSVVLVERDDFAQGTSSKSTKLVHGGVRYLEKAVLHWTASSSPWCARVWPSAAGCWPTPRTWPTPSG